MGDQLPSCLGIFLLCAEVVYTTYNISTWDMPDIYSHALGPAALRLGHVYKANPLCPCYNYSYSYNRRTCFTNHMGYTSFHITLLVIITLRGRHT